VSHAYAVPPFSFTTYEDTAMRAFCLWGFLDSGVWNLLL
jgi:hypothetical protein